MKIAIIFAFAGLLFSKQSVAQELFINTEPASNMPMRSYSIRLGEENFAKDRVFFTRTDLEFMYGFSSELMVDAMVHASNFYGNYSFNNFGIYAKYRLHTNDGFKSHFRIAAYAQAAFGTQRNTFADVELAGGNRGLETGLVFTVLKDHLALSSTLGVITLVPDVNFSQGIIFQKVANYDYSLSAGYLIYPAQYSNYKDLNINLYAELLGKYITYNKVETDMPGMIMSEHGTVLDLAIGPQFIINSISKIDLAIRSRLISGVEGFPTPSVLIRFEQMFYH